MEMEKKRGESTDTVVAALQSPFIDEIRLARPSDQFIYSAWKMYSRLTDIEAHVKYFNMVALSTCMSDAIMSKLFPSTIEKAA